MTPRDFAKRILLAGGLMLAITAAPIAAAQFGPEAGPAAPAVASCPAGEVPDTASGACKPVTDQAVGTLNPVEPGAQPLPPGSITSSQPGDPGMLPEVDGIPCTGSNTGKCIGLSENNAVGTIPQPKTSISSSP
jgi:hypothetical protein